MKEFVDSFYPSLWRSYAVLVRPLSILPKFLHIFSFTLLSDFTFSCSLSMNEVVKTLTWDHRFLSYEPLYYFTRDRQEFCTTGANWMYRDCIALAVYSNSQVTMGGAFDPMG